MPNSTNNESDNRETGLKTLTEKIKKVRVAMLTTVSADGKLHSRPMATQEAKSDGNLWFFTSLWSEKTDELLHNAHVNISYADPDSDTYVSVSGIAKVLKDKEKTKELWKPFLKAWFPEGIDSPDLVLLKIEISNAEYWDNHQSKMVQLFRIVQSIITGDVFNDGEHREIKLK